MLCPGTRVDAEFVHRVDQHADIVAEDFAECFVDLCRVTLAPQVAPEFALDHQVPNSPQRQSRKRNYASGSVVFLCSPRRSCAAVRLRAKPRHCIAFFPYAATATATVGNAIGGTGAAARRRRYSTCRLSLIT